jgi:Flp pilus assembly protein TadG
MTKSGRRRPYRDERGSATELVIIAPVLIMFLLFVVGVGRLVSARAAVDGAARDAAREASVRRDAGSAQKQGTAVAQQALAQHNINCQSQNINVSPNFQPGGGGSVTVDVDCTVNNSDAVISGLPGTQVLHGHFVAPVDLYRGS